MIPKSYSDINAHSVGNKLAKHSIKEINLDCFALLVSAHLSSNHACVLEFFRLFFPVIYKGINMAS